MVWGFSWRLGGEAGVRVPGHNLGLAQLELPASTKGRSAQAFLPPCLDVGPRGRGVAVRKHKKWSYTLYKTAINGGTSGISITYCNFYISYITILKS